ncbi:MAG: secondary thiamine-phosphate synthase enzyme YjbQ [Mariprofundus sp.]
MKQVQHALTIPCRNRGFTDFSHEVKKQVHASGILTGLLNLFIKDIGCSLSIQENTNPELLENMEILIAHSAPEEHAQHHADKHEAGDVHDHTRMALTTLSLNIPVQNGRPILGPWQAICLYEHHSHARNRRVFFHLIGD